MAVKQDEKKIVLARLQAMPAGMSLSIGDYGKLSKQELIEHVSREDDVGQLVVEFYIAGMRSLVKEVVAHRQ
jgi:ribosomal protein L30E